ncbi:MCE family protein [Nitriliruptor alkaliphilus]|uniref:MCE family protein n=1 Tax=Nitriliruptor alkaliphilus TaxID=427918 RepID=UPI000695EDCC|nr:MCE family protein [Nitriliruptor alkaliphilus]
MSGLSSRVGTNVVVVVVLSVLLVAGAFATYASGVVFDDSYRVSVALPEAGGVLPDQQVTVMGRAVGQVREVEVTEEGVLLTLSIQGDQRVPSPARATVLRRSPIGEQAIDLAPPETGWEPAERDSRIETTEVTIAPEVANLLDQTVALFSAIDADDVSTVVEELAIALDGRGDTLRRLGRDSLDLNRTLVGGIPEFERLLDASEATLAVLRDQRDTLRSAIGHGADLTEVFAEQRPNIEALLDTATPALDQLDAFLLNTRPDLECLMGDLTALNDMLLGPSTYQGANGPNLYASKLDELERGLALHSFFFQQGFSLVAQPDSDTGLLWLRVLLVGDEPQTAEFYADYRDTPQTRPGAACVSEAFGRGTDAVRQPGVQPPHETAPEIDYAPRVAATNQRVTPEGRSSERHEGDRVTPVPASTTTGGDGTSAAAEREPAATELLAGSADDDLATTGTDLGIPVATGVALLGLPLLGWGGWWLRRYGSRR